MLFINLIKIKMKKNKIYLILMFLILNISFSYAYIGVEGKSLAISTIDIEPNQINVGDNIVLSILVSNDGQDAISNLKVNIDLGNNFVLNGQDVNLKDTSYLNSGSSLRYTYYLKSNSNLKTGVYPIKISANYDTFKVDKTISVRVIGKPQIILNSNYSQEYIAPGDEFNMNINIENLGTGIAKNIKIEPITTGFIMKNSNVIFIKKLNYNSSYQQIEKILLSQDLESKPQKFDFKITYENELGEESQITQSVGLNIINKVKLDVISIKSSSDKFILSKNSEFLVRVENLGQGDAKNVEVSINNDNFNGEKKGYIGELKENEDSSVVFRIAPQRTGNNVINFIIKYNDDLGTHEINKTFTINVESKSDNNLIYMISAIAVLVLVFGFYHIKSKSKK